MEDFCGKTAPWPVCAGLCRFQGDRWPISRGLKILISKRRDFKKSA
jgi:hypothetical protein